MSRFSVYCTFTGTRCSWLVHTSPGRAIRVQVVAGDIVLCSWARQFTLTVPLFTQVYKWVPANLILGVTLRWNSIPSRVRVEILLVASCYGNRDKLRPDGPLNWLVCRLYMKINKEKLQTMLIGQVLFHQIIVFYVIISEHRRI